MFQGSLPHNAIKIISNIVKEWNCDRVYIGCSGNFTIERSISSIVECPITSNDVTIYSSYIGKYFANQSLEELTIKQDNEFKDCEFLKDYMSDDVSKVATMILASDILPYSNPKEAYSKRMLRGYKEQYPRMHELLCEKLKEMKTKIDTFYHGDVMKMLDEIPSNCGFISFPPFFKGGYEKMWNNIENFFEYTEPDYEMFDPNVHIKKFCEKVSKLDNFCIGTEREVPELEEYFSGTLNTGPNKLIYFYSKTDKKHYVKQNKRPTKAKPIIRIGKEDQISENIVVKEITLDQFNEIRALYLSTTVTSVGTPSISYGLFSDNKLFGVFALANSMMLGGSDKLEKPTAYLLTDFAISPTCEKNLSKLVLYCILSKEVKFLAEGVWNKRLNSIATNAFSRNPVSMKYRGLFEQFNRRPLDKDENGNITRWNLSYGAKLGQWTIKEGYEKWRKTNGNKSNKSKS